MAFFGLGDINFNQDAKRTFGPLSALEGSPFEKSTLKYPLDVGSFDKGHYMVFFVREQKKTNYSAAKRGGISFSPEQEKAIQDQLAKGVSVSDRLATSKVKNVYAAQINQGLENLISRGTNQLRQSFGVSGAKVANVIDGFVSGPTISKGQQKTNDVIENSIKSITDKSAFGILNTTQLTTDAIALYMPDSIAFSSRQSYDGLAPGKELIGQGLVAGSSIYEEYQSGGFQGAFNSLKKSGALQMAAGKALEKFNLGGDTARLGIFAATGKVQNPMLELIYSSPDFRQFSFEFFFWPRSESEAYEVQKIVDRFRFHQSPELDKIGSNQSGLLIPPSEFEIKFFYAGRQNPNIPAISSCILESIDINYTPNGWSAYEVPGENDPALGRTGMPVGIQLTLQFRETTYITKEDFSEQKIGRSTSTTSSIAGIVNSGGRFG